MQRLITDNLKNQPATDRKGIRCLECGWWYLVCNKKCPMCGNATPAYNQPSTAQVHASTDHQGSNPLEWSPEAIWYDRLCLRSIAIRAMAIEALWPEEPWIPIVRWEPI